MKYLLIGILVVFASIGGYASAQVHQPAAGACYSSDGVSVETTYLSGGGDITPVVSSADVEQFDGGWIVTHRTTFWHKTIGYLPMVDR